MDVRYALLPIMALISLGIGLFTSFSRRNEANIAYSLFTVWVALWAFGLFMFRVVTSLEIAYIWNQEFIVAAALISNSFLHFSFMYPKARLHITPIRRIMIYAPVILVLIGVLVPGALIKDVVNQDWGRESILGPWYLVYGLYFGTLMTWAFVNLFHSRQETSGVIKRKLTLIIIGLLIAITFGTTFNLIFILLGNYKYIWLGPYSTFAMVLTVAYAILKYRFLNVRLTLARSFSFAFLIATVFVIYGLLLAFAVPVISRLIDLNAEIVAGAAALASIPIARFIQKKLTSVTDSFLFQNKIDLRKALTSIGKELSGTIRIEEVTRTILFAMTAIIRAKKVAIFLRQPNNKAFEPHTQKGMNNLRTIIQPDNAIVKYLQHKQSIIIAEELGLKKEQERSPKHITEIEEVEQAFIWLDIAVVLPLYVNKKLTGLIALGDKLSGTPYLQDDINFLSALAPQAATALENARLYQESLKFSEKLKAEVKRATHELQIANAQLRDLDKAKSEFLSIASHQLYTPLTALRGYLSMLQEGDYGKINSKQKPIINILEVSSTRLISLIKNLLDVSRIESGRLELNLESVDFVILVKGLVQDLMPNALNKKIKLQFHNPRKSLPHIVADQERVRQVVLNIIDNAIKYTDSGRVDVRVHRTDHTITLSVSDTGRGMTADEIAKLFTKFTRVGGASRYRKEGTGLGLYVAKQIIREHHGDVEVASPGLNQGSTFYVHLPAEGSPHALKAGEKLAVEIKTEKS